MVPKGRVAVVVLAFRATMLAHDDLLLVSLTNEERARAFPRIVAAMHFVEAPSRSPMQIYRWSKESRRRSHSRRGRGCGPLNGGSPRSPRSWAAMDRDHALAAAGAL